MNVNGRFAQQLALVALLFWACAFASLAFGQSEAHDNEGLLGIKPYQTYHFGDIDSVDMESGNLTVKIPLYSLPQRGRVPLSYSLVLNTGGFTTISGQVLRQHYGFVPVLDGDLSESTVDANCSDGCAPFDGIIDSTGAFHYTGPWYIPFDGSDLIYTTHPDGLKVGGFKNSPSDWGNTFTDTNNNTIFRNNATYKITDTLGRTFDDISVPVVIMKGTEGLGWGNWQVDNGVVDPTCSSVAWGAYSSFSWTVPAPNASAGTVTFLFYFGQSGATQDTFLRAVVLPGSDGKPNCSTYWGFDYSSEDLTSIRYPTGASIQYKYETYGTGYYAPLSYYPVKRVVTSRTLTQSNGVTGTWYYCFPIVNNCGGIPLAVPAAVRFTDYPATAMIDPDGNETDIEFNQETAVGSYLETERKIYSGTVANGGTLLKTVRTTYRHHSPGGSIPMADPAAMAVPDSTLFLRQSVTTILEDAGLSTTTTYDYAKTGRTMGNHAGCAEPDCPIYYSKPISAIVTGYDGQPLQTQKTYYLWQKDPQYLNLNMLDRIAASGIYDGSGLGTPKSFSCIYYDSSDPDPGGCVSAYASNPNVTLGLRGNATATMRMGDDHWITTTKSYDGNGMVTGATDANNNPTTYKYDGTGAFLSEIDYPTTLAWDGKTRVEHKEFFSFDPNSGEATAHAGQNCAGLNAGCAEQANYTYDTLGRIQTITPPSGGGNTKYTYHDGESPWYAIDKQVTVSHWLHSETYGDDLGQPVSKIADKVVESDTTYDTFGRVVTASNPYYVSPGSGDNDSVLIDQSHGVTTGLTTSRYDALGRSVEVDRPDGSKATTSYAGSCTTVTDEWGDPLHPQWGNSRQSCTDALGRVVQVTEYGGTLGTFVTDYRYDALGNLVCVDQQGEVAGSGCDGGAAVGGDWRVRRFTYDSLSRLTKAENPESGAIQYTYDDNGNVKTKTDANNVVTTYCYDRLNRLTGKGYGTGVNCNVWASLPVRYGYDVPDPALADRDKPTYGKRTVMDDATGHTFWNYDWMGRPVRVQHTVTVPNSTAPAMIRGAAYAYNYDGTVAAITYPSGRQVVYGYNNLGMTTRVWKNDPKSGQVLNYVNGAVYTPGGQLAEVNLGAASGCFGGIMGEFSYNNRLQPVHVLYTHSGTPLGELTQNSCQSSTGEFMHRMYTYKYADANRGLKHLFSNGNVTGVKNCLDSTRDQSFEYDALNRVSAATSGYWGEKYTIDPWGNLTSIENGDTYSSLEAFSLKTTAGLREANAAPSNQLPGARSMALGVPGTYTAFTYDAAGNQKNDGAHWYQYDNENRISKVDNGATATYIYDGDGQRVVKSTGGYYAVYWYGAEGEVLAESDENGDIQSEYVFFNGKRLTRTDAPNDPMTARLRYYLSDHLGSTAMVTDETFNPLQDTDYYPYGGIAYRGGAGDTNHYKFTGKERDDETGNDYFGARYYASNIGRFMTPDWSSYPDPIPYVKIANPQTLNIYAYVGNDPLNGTDANGHWLACNNSTTQDDDGSIHVTVNCHEVPDALSKYSVSIEELGGVIAASVEGGHHFIANNIVRGVGAARSFAGRFFSKWTTGRLVNEGWHRGYSGVHRASDEAIREIVRKIEQRTGQAMSEWKEPEIREFVREVRQVANEVGNDVKTLLSDIEENNPGLRTVHDDIEQLLMDAKAGDIEAAAGDASVLVQETAAGAEAGAAAAGEATGAAAAEGVILP